MPNDLFGGLGGLMKGLSGFMPQDDPNVKMMNAQNEVSDLKKQEGDLFGEIGRLAWEKYGAEAFPQQADKLQLVQSNLTTAQSKLQSVAQEKKDADAVKEAQEAKTRCPNCGVHNPDGVKFCQECGSKLGIAKAFCTNCGAENPPGTRFCGECGAKMGD